MSIENRRTTEWAVAACVETGDVEGASTILREQEAAGALTLEEAAEVRSLFAQEYRVNLTI